ncbi:MAG: hypothetical protein HGA24_09405, partial [Candidatus Aminicenantes bacterium]|nr:hypothetical protein [Candidatus Aminicenantes bacterium]
MQKTRTLDFCLVLEGEVTLVELIWALESRGDLARVLDTLTQLPTGTAVADAYQQISADK